MGHTRMAVAAVLGMLAGGVCVAFGAQSASVRPGRAPLRVYDLGPVCLYTMSDETAPWGIAKKDLDLATTDACPTGHQRASSGT
ncbi:MAG: hypothetical protein ACRD3C_03770 [Vicinamibacterales bacterium]